MSDLSSAELVRTQVDRILASSLFARTERLSRFLKLVTDMALKGHGDQIKEYWIGVEVFDRGKDFDPRVDPIVRMQAGKLRSRLVEYYSSDGRKDPIIIHIPKGSYVPVFEPLKTEAATTAPSVPSIAVLPFSNMSSDKDNEYFSDGLTEELINGLTRIQGLRVVARTSVFAFKDKNEDIRDIGRKLSVGTILEGSVRKAADQIRITAQLINVADGYHIWSRTFQRELKDVFAIQEEISESIVNAVMPTFGGPLVQPKSRNRTPNVEAYNLWLKGRHEQREGRPNSALKRFQEALALEPNYAPAYSGIADVHCMFELLDLMPGREAFPIAREAAQKALALDPDLGQAHTSAGTIESIFNWNWPAGERHFRRAMELEPGFSTARHSYAWISLVPRRRFDEGFKQQGIALDMDPFSTQMQSAAILQCAILGDLEGAIRQYALATSLHPPYFMQHVYLALAMLDAGRCDEGIELHRKAIAVGPPNASGPLASLGYAFGVAGKTKNARAVLQQLRSPEVKPQPWDVAVVHSGLRDRKETLRWLNTASEGRSCRLIYIGVDPRFKWLHSDPDFVDILRRMNLLPTDFDEQPEQARSRGL